MKATMLGPRFKKMNFDLPLHVKNVTDEIIKQMVEKKRSEILPSSVEEMDCGEQDMVALSIQESFLDLHNRTIELRDSVDLSKINYAHASEGGIKLPDHAW